MCTEHGGSCKCSPNANQFGLTDRIQFYKAWGGGFCREMWAVPKIRSGISIGWLDDGLLQNGAAQIYGTVFKERFTKRSAYQ